MDTNTVFHVLFGLVAFLGGFVLRALWTAVDEQRKDIVTLNSVLVDKYVRKDDFQLFANRVTLVLDRIEAKIDRDHDKQSGERRSPT
jgi:predicted  nucleic acid-binding Zn-ribbon protein